MKIAHVLRKYDPAEWGGTESAVLQLLVGLKEEGVASVVYAPQLAKASRGADPFLEAGFPVQRFGSFLPVLGISSAERTRRIGMGGNLMSFSLPVRLLGERGLNVIHSHALGRLGGIARRAAQVRRIPFAATIHGGYLDLPAKVLESFTVGAGGFEYGKIFGLLAGARKVVSQADAVITCNPREADLLEQQNAARRVMRMPHGIDIGRFSVDHRSEAEALIPALRGKRVLACIGRIDGVKNQAFVVKQMPAILTRYPDAALVLAGPVTDQVHYEEIKAFIREHHLADNVHLPGLLPPGDPRLVGLYQRADVLVLPSLSETFGLVLVEAWSAGTAVLSTPTSGALQVIQDGINGHIFHLERPGTLLAGLERIFEDPSGAAAAVERGRNLARDSYSRRAVAKRFTELYEGLRCAT